MYFCGLQSLTASFLLYLVTAGIVNGFECSAGCNPENGFCEKPGECRCRPGWQGTTCEQCVPFAGCLHGTCERAWQCICEDGWAGSQCDVESRPCSLKPCSDNSTCIETGEGEHTCVCPHGYTGENCQSRMGPCLTNGSPCQNGGSCTDEGGLAVRSSCLCPSGFTGDFCEIDGDDCEPNPCANGGTCTSHGTGYHTCVCPSGFSGPDCNSTLLHCSCSPCANGGKCLEGRGGGFRCLCRPGFDGRTCAVRRARPARPRHYIPPSHEFHKLARPSERDLLRIAMKENARAPNPLVTRSQVICFAVLGLLTCLVVLGTTGIIFFNRCEAWVANAKYSQLVRQQRDYLLSARDHSINVILPEKIKMASYGNHYTSL